jgi:hypothetical protein
MLALYFKKFPTIINASVTNFFIFIAVFTLTLLLVYGAFILKKTTDLYFLLPQSLIFSFIARAVPNLRLSYPPLHDPYFHFVCTLNVIEYGTLKPILGWWYGGVDRQLHWPDIHLITVSLVKITGIDTMQFFRFQEPAMGIVLFLAVFLLAKTVTESNSVALLAGLFASLNDILIFFQSEYHPEGISFVYFVLLLYTFIKSRQVIDVRYRCISLFIAMVFALSHYFTPFFLSIVFSSYVAVTLITKFLSNFSVIRDKYRNIFENVISDHVYFLIVILFSLFYHLFVFSGAFYDFLYMASRPVVPASLVSIGQNSVPLFTSILSLSKWGLFILAIISIMLIFKTKNTNEFRLGVLVVCIMSGGVIGNYVVSSPLNRLIAYYVPFAAIFASLTLNRYIDGRFGGVHKNRKVIVSILIASILMTAGFFNSQTPAYFFKDTKIDTFYWYSNRLPSMNEYKSAGEWIGAFSGKNPSYRFEFDTRIIPFYYGKQSDSSLIYRPATHSLNYIMINPKIPYKDKMFISSNLNLIYNNNELDVYL